MNYDCDKLQGSKNEAKYYDKILVTLKKGEATSTFEYTVVCDQERLRGFDVNFLVLFGIAVLVLVIVIKTNPLLVFNEMSPQE